MNGSRLALAALLAGLFLTAGAKAEDTMGSMSHDKAMSAAADTPASKAYAKANADMMRGMSVPMTGDADRDFVAMMIAHHEGAIAMAKVELAHGKDPMLHKLAQNVISAQTKEIAEMKAWQQKHAR